MTSMPASESRRTWAWREVVVAWWTRFNAPVIGLFAGILAVAGAGVPSYWGDEAASVLSAERSIPSLLAMLDRVDAVHGVYYLFLHGWIGLVGTSEAAVRFPSAVAIGFAAAGTVILGRRLLGPSTGILAGVAFAVLPIVTRMGMEARSYAFAMAAAAWLMAWFVALVRRREGRWWIWACFAAASAATMYLFLYLGLLVLVQLTIAIAERAPRATIVRWLAAAVAAAVLAAPIVLMGAAERAQIRFLARRHYATVESVVVGQWFGSAWFAAVSWSLVIVAVAAAFAGGSRVRRRGVVVAAVWMLAPTAALLLGNAFVTPMYNPRYLSFCAPAVALLIAVGLRALGDLAAALVARHGVRRVPLIGLAVVIAVAVPGYLAQRGPFAKDHGSDFRQSAEAIAAHASAGDAIVFDQSTKRSRRPRLAMDLYPREFAGLDDVELKTPLAARAWLWDSVASLSDVGDRLSVHSRVWAVESGTDTSDVAALESLGYAVEQSIHVHRTVIYELVKE
jgi:mannosyltransferase